MTRDDMNRWEAEIDSWRQRYEALLKMMADNQYLATPIKLADKQSYELGLWHGAAAEREAWPRLDPVITWLENGCDPAEAAKELRIYAAAIRARSNT